MSKINDAIKFMEENMNRMDNLCTNKEQKNKIPEYILSVLKFHKAEILYREKIRNQDLNKKDNMQ